MYCDWIVQNQVQILGPVQLWKPINWGSDKGQHQSYDLKDILEIQFISDYDLKDRYDACSFNLYFDLTQACLKA